MSRHLLTLVAVAAILGAAGRAEAATEKWCFKWKAVYTDAGSWVTSGSTATDDYLTNDTAGVTEVPASFAYVFIKKQNPTTGAWTNVWGGNTDIAGCSIPLEILPNTTYKFTQFLWARSDLGRIYVHEDGEDWNGAVQTVETVVTTTASIPPGRSYPAPIPPGINNTRLMPVLAHIVANSELLGIPPATRIDVSTWFLNELGAGTGGLCHGTYHSDADGGHYLCISNSNTGVKYQIAHEVGHAIASENGGASSGSYAGSEGIFNGGSYCDCSAFAGGGYGHCPTSREFTGAGQGEGFAHFVAASAFNDRDEYDGVYVFYKELHKWRGDHGGTLPLLQNLPGSPQYFDKKYRVDLGTTHNVQWVENECAPPSAASGSFRHYGSEWDWLSFFWNLWTDGTSSVRYSVDDINAVWRDTVTKNSSGTVTNSENAFYCCAATDADPDPDEEFWIPTACHKYDKAVGACTRAHPNRFTVGKLWEPDSTFDVTKGMRGTAYSKYYSSNPDKYYLFRDTGIATKVNY